MPVLGAGALLGLVLAGMAVVVFELPPVSSATLLVLIVSVSFGTLVAQLGAALFRAGRR